MVAPHVGDVAQLLRSGDVEVDLSGGTSPACRRCAGSLAASRWTYQPGIVDALTWVAVLRTQRALQGLGRSLDPVAAAQASRGAEFRCPCRLRSFAEIGRFHAKRRRQTRRRPSVWFDDQM